MLSIPMPLYQLKNICQIANFEVLKQKLLTILEICLREFYKLVIKKLQI